jgi:hypothetical protein
MVSLMYSCGVLVPDFDSVAENISVNFHPLSLLLLCLGGLLFVSL